MIPFTFFKKLFNLTSFIEKTVVFFKLPSIRTVIVLNYPLTINTYLFRYV